LVKIRNYHDPRERANRLELVEACLEAGVNGITLPGSMTVPEPRLSQGKGNLTGRLVLGNTLRNIRDVYRATDGSVAIKALGGISTAADAFEAIAAGANTIELLTGLVYEGWSVAANINRGLLRLLDRAGVPDVAQLRGVKLDEPAEA
jgi:dihydroorotate dehydrogenase